MIFFLKCNWAIYCVINYSSVTLIQAGTLAVMEKVNARIDNSVTNFKYFPVWSIPLYCLLTATFCKWKRGHRIFWSLSCHVTIHLCKLLGVSDSTDDDGHILMWLKIESFRDSNFVFTGDTEQPLVLLLMTKLISWRLLFFNDIIIDDYLLTNLVDANKELIKCWLYFHLVIIAYTYVDIYTNKPIKCTKMWPYFVFCCCVLLVSIIPLLILSRFWYLYWWYCAAIFISILRLHLGSIDCCVNISGTGTYSLHVRGCNSLPGGIIVS